jgi:hypothetical protein
MKLTAAETELIELLRGDRAFGLNIMKMEDTGEWVAATTDPPFDATQTPRVGMGFSFAEAWNGRLDPTKMRPA